MIFRSGSQILHLLRPIFHANDSRVTDKQEKKTFLLKLHRGLHYKFDNFLTEFYLFWFFKEFMNCFQKLISNQKHTLKIWTIIFI